MRIIEGAGSDGIGTIADDVGPCIVIAGGGSAGHVTAALALGDAFEDHIRSQNIMYLGTACGLEARIIPEAGRPLALVRGSPVMRQNLAGKAKAAWNLTAGWRDARKKLTELRAGLVVGCGGYASAGVLLAARSMGIPCVLHEANALPGRANRLTGRFADKIYLGWDEAETWFPGKTVAITGNPLRANFPLAAQNDSGTRARPLRLLILGGSEGSPFLNAQVPLLFSKLRKRVPGLTVIHQSGPGAEAAVRAAYALLGVRAEVFGYRNDMSALYRQADFAIVCGGAMTLAEVAAVGLPSLIVPLSTAADNHQAYNARAFATRTGTSWVSESDWDTGEVVDKICHFLTNPKAREQLSASTRNGNPANAAQAIAADSLALMTSAATEAANTVKAGTGP